jgi:hypothetical protein
LIILLSVTFDEQYNPYPCDRSFCPKVLHYLLPFYSSSCPCLVSNLFFSVSLVISSFSLMVC